MADDDRLRQMSILTIGLAKVVEESERLGARLRIAANEVRVWPDMSRANQLSASLPAPDDRASVTRDRVA
jgi:hypothetical protein